MEIWILDDDIALSFEKKEKVKSFLSGRVPKLRFEVFHAIPELVDAWESACKRKRSKPQISIIEFLINQQNVLDNLPVEFCSEGLVIISSAASYGSYLEYSLKHKISSMPFIEKSQFDLKIKSQLEDYLKDQNNYDPTLKKKLKTCLSAIKELEKIYYDKMEGSVFDLASVIQRESTKHNQLVLAKSAAEFVELKDQKNLKAAALNKALKEFILACGKFKEIHQIEG